MKIEKLTSFQEKQLEEYNKEWLEIGRCTLPADRKTAEESVSKMYYFLGKKQPHFWWIDGPAVGSMVRTLLKTNLSDNLRANLEENMGANLWANLGDNLSDNLRANLEENMGANLWANLRANLWANLWANLRANLWANLSDNLSANLWANLRDNLSDNLRANLEENMGANLGTNLGDNLWANLSDNLRANLWANLSDNLSWWFWGQHEASWPAYYLWPHIALKKMHTDEQMEKLNLWLSISKSCGWWSPFDKVVFLCERPSVQAVDERGFLHKDLAPALLCRDGWPLYMLHGVRMNPEHVLTPAEKISPESVLAETNVDVRRELMRKIGPERMLSKLPHESLQKLGDYELLSVRLSDEVQNAKYLKMLNPSIGVWHLEGVEPSCNTVESALNWRNENRFENAEVLT